MRQDVYSGAKRAVIKYGSTFPYANGTADSNTVLLCHCAGATLSSAAVTLTNRLFGVPFFVPDVTTIDGLAFENTGAGDNGDKVRLGIYDSSGGYPSTLLGETGEIILDATADVRIAAMGAAVVLLPTKVYWLAIVGNASTTILVNNTATRGEWYMTRAGSVPWTVGIPIFNGGSLAGVFASHTYAALPSTFPAVATTVATDMPILGAQVQ